MAKTQTPGEMDIQGGNVQANVVPDPFDERDFEYRPRLQPLPATLDNRHPNRQRRRSLVLNQRTTEACTGFAVATLINIVRARIFAEQAATAGEKPALPEPVSHFMLYYYARRYDQFEGTADVGSSLRAAFKGWMYHGVAVESKWDEIGNPMEFETLKFIKECRDIPLGAYYRVNPRHLDDMQSAIFELGAVAVSAAIHDGWREDSLLRAVRRDSKSEEPETMYVIDHPSQPTYRGGHAFTLVGYNDIGFLVQNSWGPGWGCHGFATLTYEDWLENAYDAWVARPGVRQTPFVSAPDASKSALPSSLEAAPNLGRDRLRAHVVNLGNNGRFSDQGGFQSNTAQVDTGIIPAMKAWHESWGEPVRRIVLFAHGGTVTEASGLAGAQTQVDWWLNNHIFPVYFVWQSGPGETFVDHLKDTLRGILPFESVGFNFPQQEQVDRLIETQLARKIRWVWEEMKQNARAASDPLPPNDQDPPPGASFFVDRLKSYIKSLKDQPVEVHLVSHSAGSVFQAALLQRLADRGIPVASMCLLAPAIRVDEFQRTIWPHLQGGGIGKFTVFALTDKREQDDYLPEIPYNFYGKSIMYLVSRSLEAPNPPQAIGLNEAVLGKLRGLIPGEDPVLNPLKDWLSGAADTSFELVKSAIPGKDLEPYEVPLLGMERFLNKKPDTAFLAAEPDLTLKECIERAGGEVFFSPSTLTAPLPDRIDALRHTTFLDDKRAMTSVLLRILKANELSEEIMPYEMNAQPLIQANEAGEPLIAAVGAENLSPTQQALKANAYEVQMGEGKERRQKKSGGGRRKG
jgi:hypothetical protein